MVSSAFLRRLLWGLAVAAAFLGLCRRVSAIDTWLYLAGGEYIAKHWTIPRADVFSWTAFGHPWINHEWLFELLLYAFYTVGRLAGVAVLKAALVLAALFFQDLRLKERSVDWPWRLAVFSALFFYCREYWSERADLTTFLMASALLYAWERKQGLRRRDWAMWLWPGLFCLWANMHGGFLIGWVLIVLLAGGAYLDGSLDARRTFWWFAACVAATFVNPSGIRLHASLIQWTGRLNAGMVQEWRPTPWSYYPFWIVLGLAGGSFFSTGARRSGRFFQALFVCLFLAYAGAGHQRFAALFMACALPYAAGHILQDPRMRNIVAWIRQEERRLAVGAVALMATVAAVQAGGIEGGIDREKAYFADGAFRFIEAQRIPGPFYNDYPFGSGWLWYFKGEPRVFIDGRISSVDGYDALFNKILEAQRSPAEWEAFLSRYGVEAALIRYPFPSRADVPSIFRTYFPRSRWALVYWDDIALLFLRKDPANRAVIRQWEFPSIDPDSTRERFKRQWTEGKIDRRAVMRDLLRNQALHPDSRRVRQFLDLARGSAV